MREAAAPSPTMGMVRELARAGLAAPPTESLARWTCQRRGLLDRWGRLTAAGAATLAIALRKSQAHDDLVSALRRERAHA